MIAKSLEISIALSISFENLDFAVGDWYRKLTQYSCQLILHCFCILNKLKNTTIKCRVNPSCFYSSVNSSNLLRSNFLEILKYLQCDLLNFSSQSHFIQLFQKYTHLTPKQYRNQQSRNNMIAEPEEIES